MFVTVTPRIFGRSHWFHWTGQERGGTGGHGVSWVGCGGGGINPLTAGLESARWAFQEKKVLLISLSISFKTVHTRVYNCYALDLLTKLISLIICFEAVHTRIYNCYTLDLRTKLISRSTFLKLSMLMFVVVTPWILGRR